MDELTEPLSDEDAAMQLAYNEEKIEASMPAFERLFAPIRDMSPEDTYNYIKSKVSPEEFDEILNLCNIMCGGE